MHRHESCCSQKSICEDYGCVFIKLNHLTKCYSCRVGTTASHSHTFVSHPTDRFCDTFVVLLQPLMADRAASLFIVCPRSDAI